MLKKHKIIQSYLVFLCCDECGERMELDHYDVSNPRNKEKKRNIYRCPECGSVVRTAGAYPVTSYDYETEGEVVARDKA